MGTFSMEEMLTLALMGLFGTAVFTVLMGVEFIRRHYRTQLRALQTSADVAGAALGRYDLGETLGRILERAARDLEAEAGVVYLADPDTGGLKLIHALGLERYDRLARVSLVEPLVRQLLRDPDAVLTGVHPDSLWADLLPRRAGAPAGGSIAALSVGQEARPGVLVLAWRSAGAADGQADVLRAIRQHTRLAVNEFEAREQRLMEFNALSQRQENYRALVETGLHDMGNGLAIVRLRLELLLAGTLPLDENELRFLVGKTQAITADLTTLADPESLQLDLRPVQVEKLLELLPEMAGHKIGARRVAFSAEIEPGLPPVAGDRLMLMRVLDNLLSNAGKYNRRDGSGWARLRIGRDGDQVRFEVADNGIGIPPTDLPDLFQLKKRASNTGEIRGHGYGLWSCKHVVEAHGGRIWAESVLGQGSTFIFTIPAARPAPPAPEPVQDGLEPAPAMALERTRPLPQEAV